MPNPEFRPEVSQESLVVLTVGSRNEIVEALKTLGASNTVQAQANASFLVMLQPGTEVRKVESGFLVGKSFLAEKSQLSLNIVGRVHSSAMKLVAANDERFSLAA